MFRKFINWIKSFFSAKEENFALFHPQDRLIYSYFSGKEEVHADPLILYRKMMDVGTDLATSISVSQMPMKEAPQAQLDVVKKIRGIFSVQAFEEGGLTEVETLGLLDHFLIYCGRIKKNSRVTATSQQETLPTTPSSAEQNPVTTSTSDTGSTASEQPTEQPTPSASEQASLLDQIQDDSSGDTSQTEKPKPSSSNPFSS